MTKELFVACAGAGKTTKIVNEAIELTDNGSKVLIITYTRSNQSELVHKFKELGGIRKDLFVVKGWYSFILEDIVRPYQRCIFTKRVSGINLNSSNPHKNGKFYTPGRAEKINKKYNPKHFFDSRNHAHTEFISKLACHIISESKVDISKRMNSIYKRVYLDETQDFAGWDFTVLKKLVKSKELEFHAVGDFRQTIYHTSSNPKNPHTNEDKLAEYIKMGFSVKHLSDCWRSIDTICEFADTVHKEENYSPTISKVNSPAEIGHNGIFFVPVESVDTYIKLYKPMILRHGAVSGKYLEQYAKLQTFGASKGQTTDHVLILPTEPILKFLKGVKNPFGKSSTATSQNKLYVAITRARYSVAFIVEDSFFEDKLWKSPQAN